MSEPYQPCKPGDFITAKLWNDMQELIRRHVTSHRHDGEVDQGVKLGGDAIDPQATLSVGSLQVEGDTSLKGNLSCGGRLDRLDVADAATAEVRCADFRIGHQDRKGSTGRALVDGTDKLLINWGADWPEGVEIRSDLRVEGALSVAALGGFTAEEKEEWPNLVYYRDTENNWDEGIIKHGTAKGKFGRAGFGIHMHQSREWGVWSTGWDPLLAVEGGSGNVRIKGNVEAPSFIATNPMNQRMYPQDPKVYQEIFDAERAKVIGKLGSPSYDNIIYAGGNPWNGRHIIRYGGNDESDGNGARVVIPDGYDTVWVRVLGDRWNVIKAYFLDGGKEQLGHWAGGKRAMNCYCPDGSLGDGHFYDWTSADKKLHERQTLHQWLPIPAGRAGTLALISRPHTNSEFWLSGLAFSRNPWAHAAQSALGYHWKSNGGSAVDWDHDQWNGDVLARIPENKVTELVVPVVPSGRDKLLYLVEHNNNWNGCMHDGITVEGKPIERFMASYDNPFARHWNGKFYARYIAARIPAALVKPGIRWLKVKIDLSHQNHRIYFREIGTHDLEVPRG